MPGFAGEQDKGLEHADPLDRVPHRWAMMTEGAVREIPAFVLLSR